MNHQLIELTAEEEDMGIRIDKYISENLEELTRTYIQKLIQDGLVLVNNHNVKANYKVSAGDKLNITVPPPADLLVEAEDIPLDILYEDKDIILINKGKGMVVHPSAGHYTGTLVNGLLYHCKEELSGINGILRPGIVHRIDMNTTGVIVVCKNDKAHQSIAEQLKVHSITRKYNALVYQPFKVESGTVDAPVGRHPVDRKKMSINIKNGKNAVTHYTVFENLNNKYAHIECSLETGRTHQIRVHMASIHHPLLGDTIYGSEKDPFHLEGQALHARVLGFIHPTSKKYVEFEAPLPEYFKQLIVKLR
ncbi:MAG: pseudouridine synthase, RluA family [Anaerocolumna sp.]|jgi:23S rRNA pseudouridine1911/1915/1917 synthase|nr:pseudouridine synthase, RluA family [Anaerocolumna sp.]